MDMVNPDTLTVYSLEEKIRLYNEAVLNGSTDEISDLESRLSDLLLEWAGEDEHKLTHLFNNLVFSNLYKLVEQKMNGQITPMD